MTRRLLLQNNTSDSLSASCLAADTTITVVNGGKFPAAGEFVLLVESELMLCTSRSGNVLTVVRGQEGTTAAAHGSGLAVVMTYSAYCVQRYGRDNDPGFDSSRPPFRLLDASGNVLTKSSFTTVNLSTATISDDSSGSISIRKAGGQGTVEDFTLLTRAMPASGTVIASLRWHLVPAANNIGLPSTGIGFRESGTGKFVVLLPITKTYHPAIEVYEVPSPTTVGTVVFALSPFVVTSPIWFKMVDDGTTFITIYSSSDGENWVQLYQASRTAYMTGGPDQVFFTANNWDCAIDCIGTLAAWLES